MVVEEGGISDIALGGIECGRGVRRGGGTGREEDDGWAVRR